MIVLDTNVISELMKVDTDPQVIAWLDSQPPESIWTTSVCIFEIGYGLHSLPDGRRKRSLQNAFNAMLQEDLRGHVLDFDLAAAEHAAVISARLRSTGRPVEIRDVQIAGIVAARRATLVTRNVRHFVDADIVIVNPWDENTPG